MQKISETLNTKHYSVSANKLNNTKALKRSVTDVRNIAIKLSDQLNNPSRFEYYCKVAWRLSDTIIWNNLETALKGDNPQKYFSWLCRKDLAE